MPVSHSGRGFGLECHVSRKMGSILKGLAWPFSPSPQMDGFGFSAGKNILLQKSLHFCLQKKPKTKTHKIETSQLLLRPNFSLLPFFPQTPNPETLIFSFHPRITPLPQNIPPKLFAVFGGCALPSVPDAPAASPSWKGGKKKSL